MYRISGDPRVKTSADMIASGLELRLTTRRLTDVTVSEICAAACVGRATFYRLFDTPVDVLQYHVDTMMDQLHARLDLAGSHSLRDIFIQALQTFMQRPHLLDAILVNDRLDILRQSFWRNSDPIRIAAHIENMDQQQMDYLLYLASAITAIFLRVWHMHGKREDAGTLLRYIQEDCQLLSDLLR